MILSPAVVILLFAAFITYPTICKSLKCYECSEDQSCGHGKTHHIVDCAGKCMIYQNENNNGTIVRSCCLDDCNNNKNSHKAYFCSKDRCNGIHSDSQLLVIKKEKPHKRIHLRTARKETRSSLHCFDCTAHNPDCAVNEATLVSDCQTCIVYLNANDGNNVVRRCCKSGCGSPGTIDDYDGRKAYFCSSNQCNGIGAEKVLTGEADLDSINAMIATLPTITTTLTTTSTTTVTTTIQTSFECYECSGPNCGREGSSVSANCPSCMVYRNPHDQRPNCGREGLSVSNNCPSCMVYRNPNDQTIIERRCCWWTCGPSNSIGSHNGLETYFCAADKCNGFGTEFALSPLVTTTTITTTTMTTTTTAITTTMSSPTKITTTTTTSSSSSCVLNCQNGGTPETEDGCFCYCLENTNGRECENVDCAQSDVNSEICTIENQQLCDESETFAFECLHLCGKC
ncbi:unnamed protein product [Rotaria sordida]|uniref:Uncharacterized protein n=1 Tax=Rotaria sordida TaxID=392033 RepID=A0A813Y142_9BILA|nr:unnamed protein product [Rotaria sordida]